MCAPCERVRRGSEAATLVRHSGQSWFSDVSAQMQLRQPESVGPAPWLV
jgi:hypothetical protein